MPLPDVAASDLIATPSLTNIFDNAAKVTDLKAMVAKSEAVAAAAGDAGDTDRNCRCV